MLLRVLVAGAVAVFPTAPLSATGASRADVQFRALTPEGVEKKVSVKDDALELVATLTTIDVFREKRGLLGAVPFDVFLRAFVDKKSGNVRYQVYATFQYASPIWTRWRLANYETAEGPRETKLDVLARIRGRCGRYTGCPRLETVAFPIGKRVLRNAAASYRPEAGAVWQFKFKAQTGVDYVAGLSAAEIGGLLLAVDKYKRVRGAGRPLSG